MFVNLQARLLKLTEGSKEMKTIQKNLIAIAIAGVVTPFAAQADIEEIIVTANKRE